MLMIDFEQLKIITVDDYMTINIILDWNPSFLDESFRTFQKALNDKVVDELDKHLLKKPVSFQFITRFDNNDLDLIADNLVGSIVEYMSAGKRQREARLGRPKSLEQVLMLDGSIMDCINNTLDTDIFNITIFNKHDKEFFSLLDGAVIV
jgi:hypothetical protein